MATPPSSLPTRPAIFLFDDSDSLPGASSGILHTEDYSDSDEDADLMPVTTRGDGSAARPAPRDRQPRQTPRDQPGGDGRPSAGPRPPRRARFDPNTATRVEKASDKTVAGVEKANADLETRVAKAQARTWVPEPACEPPDAPAPPPGCGDAPVPSPAATPCACRRMSKAPNRYATTAPRREPRWHGIPHRPPSALQLHVRPAGFQQLYRRDAVPIARRSVLEGVM